jgi:hypothetical protein
VPKPLLQTLILLQLKVLIFELGLHEVGDESEGDPHEEEEWDGDDGGEAAGKALVNTLTDKGGERAQRSQPPSLVYYHGKHHNQDQLVVDCDDFDAVLKLVIERECDGPTNETERVHARAECPVPPHPQHRQKEHMSRHSSPSQHQHLRVLAVGEIEELGEEDDEEEEALAEEKDTRFYDFLRPLYIVVDASVQIRKR